MHLPLLLSDGRGVGHGKSVLRSVSRALPGGGKRGWSRILGTDSLWRKKSLMCTVEYVGRTMMLQQLILSSTTVN